MSELNEIVNTDNIKKLLEKYKGEKQLIELKSYLLQFHDELKEIGVDPSKLAWNIYITKGKL